MMRTVTQTLYTFDELQDEDAKEKAREWGRRVISEDPPWMDEWADSLRMFCEEFDVKLQGWDYGNADCDVTIPHDAFRGRKLRDYPRDRMPTGYCGDCPFWETFHDEWKRTGDPKYAFETAIHRGMSEWRDDYESCFSDEYIDDFLIANEYEFDETGQRE